jgi:hypothetical protein
MLIVVVKTRTKDWQALTQAIQQAADACPPQIATRFSVYRNAQNAAQAWLLIECSEACTDSDLQAWLEELVAGLDEQQAEHAVLECIAQLKQP